MYHAELERRKGAWLLLVGSKCCAPRGRVELMWLFKVKLTILLKLYPQLSGRVPSSVAPSICSPLSSVMFAQLSLKVPVKQVKISWACAVHAQLTTSSHGKRIVQVGDLCSMAQAPKDFCQDGASVERCSIARAHARTHAHTHADTHTHPERRSPPGGGETYAPETGLQGLG